MRLDFDDFLARPAEALASDRRLFGSPIERGEAERLASGPLMGRYSKALEHEYSPQLRREVLARIASRQPRCHRRRAELARAVPRQSRYPALPTASAGAKGKAMFREIHILGRSQVEELKRSPPRRRSSTAGSATRIPR